MKRRQLLAGLPGWALLSFVEPCAASASPETLTVTGAGTAQPLIERLTAAFAEREPAARLRLIKPALGSRAAARGLTEGIVDLALLGRPLRPAEAAGGSTSTPLARTPLLFAAHGPGWPDGLDAERLAAVYEGRLKRWPQGGAIRVVLRAAMHSDSELIRSLDPRVAAALDRALARPGMVFAQDDLEAVELLQRIPGTFGATTLALLRAHGSQLSAQTWRGIAPSLDALRSGDYPLARAIHVALPPEPSRLARRFHDFLRTAAARETLRALGYQAEAEQ